MKKFIFSMFILVLLVGTISAFEFDNWVNYEENDLKIRIVNSFNFGEELGTATLKSHKTVDEILPFGFGKEEVVMYYDFNFANGYVNGLGDISFTNVTDGKTIQKDYSLVYWGDKVRDTYRRDCITSLNKTTTCNKVVSGTEIYSDWLPYDSRDISSGEIRIGLKTYVGQGDNIDGVWNIAGKNINRHSEWIASLNVSLISYYKLDQTFANVTVIDSLQNNTAINSGASRGQPGIIGTAFGYDTTLGNVTNLTTNFGLGTTSATINAWVNITDLSQSGIIVLIGSWTGANGYGMSIFGADIDDDGNNFGASVPAVTTLSSGSSFQSGFSMITIQLDAGGDIDLWLNGTSVLNSTTSPNAPDDESFLGGTTAGVNRYYNGVIDEVGIWNRVLTGAEIVHLYNDGVGVTFPPGPLILPTVTLNSPIEDFNTSNQTIDFNGTAVSTIGIVNVSLFIDGILNETNSSGISGVDYLFTKIVSEGSHNWTYESCNSNGCTTASERDFTIDITPPNLTLTSPIGDQGTFSVGRNLTLSWNVSDINIDTCLFDYVGVNTTVSCALNISNFTVTDSSQTFLTFFANDTLGQISSANTTWSYSFIENNVTFNTNVSETSSQFFEINLTTSLSVLSITAELNYDGTDFISNAACGINCIVNNTINIPLVPTGETENKDFFWEINIFNGTDSISVTTTTRQQNVTRIHLETCDGSFTTQALNFSASDERNLTRVNPFDFDGTFDIWLGGGSVKRNNNFTNPSIAEKRLCILPNETFFVDAQIDYNGAGNSTLYTQRNHFLQNNTISNVNQDISLFLLDVEFSTSFILKVQDDNLLPLEDHIIKTQRFYPGENIFRTVQIAKTSENGKSIGFFETETIDYRFIISLDNLNLLTTAQGKIVGEITPFTLTFTIGENLGKPWETLENITDLEFTLLFNNSNDLVTYTYIDTSGNFTLGTLIIEEQNQSFATNTVLCNVNSTQSSATLTCNMSGNTTGLFSARGFIDREGDETLISQVTFIIQTLIEIIGLTGVFLAWFLILISAFAFKFNEIAGIFMVNATVIFVNIIGLVSFGTLAITALVGVSIIIVVVMQR